MKVKDLIIKLEELDQEKDIKFVEAEGYEYEEWATDDLGIELYEDTIETYIRENGEVDKYYPIYKDSEDSEGFYILGATVEKGKVVDQRNNTGY